MFKALVALCAFLLCLQDSEAVRCWKCENALNNDDCLRRGFSVECDSASAGCLSEIRYHRGLIPPIRITKRCKQGLACDNNVFQNDRGNHPFQCNPKIPASICRCCCKTEDCNKSELRCLPSYPDCPELVLPRNGEMDCKYDTDPPSIGESCEFSCDEGYEMEGAKVLVCGPTNNRVSEWNYPEPVCKPLTCKPEYTSIPNGQVDCTRRNFVRSECTFVCDSGHVMEGQLTATCSSSQNWDNQPPKCIPVTCPPPMTPPTFGTVSCSNFDRLGSVCSFACYDGYSLLEAPTSTCVDDGTGNRFGRWSHPVPRCEMLVCQPQSRNPTNGKVYCTNANNGGSVCTYRCNGEYSIFGSRSRVCEDVRDGYFEGQWSAREPICHTKDCDKDRPLAPENGMKLCTNSSAIGSVCTFICDRFHTMTGPKQSRCIVTPDGPRWSHAFPTCEADICQPPRETLRHGVVSCTRSNYVNSLCTFTCTEPGYSIYPGGLTTNKCQPSKQWSRRAPCCTRPCPPNAKMDAVVLLDSSPSVGASNWAIVKRFISNIFASFTISEDTTRFAAIRYNNVVDNVTQILLSDYPDDRVGLLAAFDKLPYNGNGKRTGQAISYAGDVLMTPENGDRPDFQNVLIVVTNGMSHDDVLAPSQALRERGVLIVVIGMVSGIGGLNYTQLVEISGDQNLVWTADSLIYLDDIVASSITGKICGDPCDW